jgi:hypothetical protein
MKMKSYMWVPVLIAVSMTGCKANSGKIPNPTHSQAARKADVPPSSKPKETVVQVKCPLPGSNDLGDSMSEDEIKDNAYFWNEVQTAIREGRRDKVVGFMHYPLLDGVKGRVSVRSAHEFVADYDKLFPVGLRQYILGHDSSCVHRVGDKGYMIGSGVLWFDIYDKGEFRIFTINGTEPWDD